MLARFRFLTATRQLLLRAAVLLAAGNATAQPTHDTRAGQPLPGLPFWQWQNPAPQGYVLNDLWAFTDSAALLVGNHGLALRTLDQGHSWTTVNVGTDRDLVSVAFATSQTGWVAYSTPATNSNTQTGGVGPGEIRRTTNGGATWTRQPIGETYSVRMRKVLAFGTTPSATTVFAFYDWARRYPNGLYSSFGARLRRSLNGGTTWAALALPVPDSFTPTNDLTFATPTAGWVGGGGGAYNSTGWLARTLDGGQTWQPVTPDSGRVIVQSLCFPTPQQGWVAGARRTPTDGGPRLLRTLDGGQSWQPMAVPATPGVTPAVTLVRFAPDGLHGLIELSYPYGAYRTADGGLTWSAVVIGSTTYSYSRPPIAQVRASGVTWLQAADTRLLVSTTFGDSARLAYVPASFSADALTNVQFPDPGTGWAGAGAQFVDFNGRYTQWYPGGLSVLRTTDRGDHWRVLRLDSVAAGLVAWPPAAQSFPTTTAFPDRDTAYVAGVERDYTPNRAPFVLRTTDGGATWTRLPLPATRQAPIKMSFLDGRRGLIVGDSGLALLTTDAGQSWRSLTINGRHRLYSAGWIDAQHLYAGGDSTNVAHSADGGLTWRVQTYDSLGIFGNGTGNGWPAVGYSQNTRNLYFTTPTRGYQAGGGNTIQRTTNGGRTWWYGLSWFTPPGVPDLYIQGGRTSEIQQVVFRTPQEGYAFGADQFRTLDGGATWTVWAQTTTPTRAGALLDRYNAYVVGESGTILRYSEKLIRTDTALARSRFCLAAAADSLAVAFTTEGTFSAAEQDFRVELSNAHGRFRKGQTTLVGRGTASPLVARLPATLPAGTYRLRVIRADSTVLGLDNGVDLLVNRRPAPVAVAPADSISICAGDSAQLTAPTGFAAYHWSTGATTATVWVRAAGAYAVQVGSAADCLSPISDSVRVRVKPRPAQPVITVAPQVSGLVLLTSSAPAGNQWFWNGQLLAGATNSTYVVSTAAQSGAYTVQTTRANCVSPVSAPAPVQVLSTEEAATAAGISVAPNPARAGTVVRATAANPVEWVRLTDLSGREVARVPGTGAETPLSLTGIATGTYLLRADLRGGATITRRLVVGQ